jgi:hypothetical protein
MTPGEVLDAQRVAYESLRFPPKVLSDFFSRFFEPDILEHVRNDYGGAAGGPWLQMFMPATSGPEFLEMVRRPLHGAETYQVAAPIVRAVTQTYEATADKTEYVRAEDLPSEAGFAWLDEPAVLQDASGARLATRALSWGPQFYRFPEEWLAGRARPASLWKVTEQGGGWDGVRITSWTYAGDIDDFTDRELARKLLSAGLPLTITHSQFLPFGAALRSRMIGADDVEPDDLSRWLHTLWMFMGTEIVTADRPRVQRAFARRAQRTIGTSSVRVILLRRAVRSGDREHQTRDIDWSCCWVVQSHWRHLEGYEPGHAHHRAAPASEPGSVRHCAVCGGRITYVRSYVKGPEGLPLKAVPKVLYNVSR